MTCVRNLPTSGAMGRASGRESRMILVRYTILCNHKTQTSIKPHTVSQPSSAIHQNPRLPGLQIHLKSSKRSILQLQTAVTGAVSPRPLHGRGARPTPCAWSSRRLKRSAEHTERRPRSPWRRWRRSCASVARPRGIVESAQLEDF